MNKVITKDDLTELGAPSNETRLSIFLPTHPSGHEVNEKQDALLFKDLVNEVAEKMSTGDFPIQGRSTVSFLQPAYELLENLQFWLNLEKGLAVYITEGMFKTILLPYNVDSFYSLGKSFNILPLIELIQGDRPYFLLNLSEGATSFFEGHKYRLRHVFVDGLRWDMQDEDHQDQSTGQQRFRTGDTAVGAAAGEGLEHQSSNMIDEKEYAASYMRELDQVLWQEKLQNEHRPLLIAGKESHVNLYREVSRYPHVIKERFVEGLFDENNYSTLSSKAQEAMSDYFKEDEGKAKDNFGVGFSEGLSTHTAEKIVPAAYYGQINDLFIAQHASLFGRFDIEHNVFAASDKGEGENLIPVIAYQCLAKGGNVYILPQEEMPDNHQLAATLRYAT
jgi:hypothetical protein